MKTGAGSGRSPVNATGTPSDPFAVLRSRSYLRLLALAAILGVPISAVALGFLQLVAFLQRWLFVDLPKALGFPGEPLWWPLPLLAVAGVVVGLTIRYLPGRGGHSPADGLETGGAPSPVELPGIVLAALATLSLGAVLGPEAPLIALGGGLAGCAVRLAQRGRRSGTNARAEAMAGVAGSFAAISTLLGSPILGAFLLMEMAGVAGPTLGIVLVPGLLAAGVGSLIFVGLSAWTGLGAVSLSIPDLPRVGQPDLAQFGWAIGIGLAAAGLGSAIRWLALFLRPHVERRPITITPVVGLAVGALAVAFAAATGANSSQVLFSGQTALGPLLAGGARYAVWALALLVACKGLAYGASMSGFRGGPVFPSMFLGAAGGIALSHLHGLPMVPAAGMGIGAMGAVMLRLPMTSVLLATLLLLSDGLATMPLVIVAVVVAYVASARLVPRPPSDAHTGARAP